MLILCINGSLDNILPIAILQFRCLHLNLFISVIWSYFVIILFCYLVIFLCFIGGVLVNFDLCYNFFNALKCLLTEVALFLYYCCGLCVLRDLQIKELLSKCPEAISRSLLKARLSDRQWESVMLINHALRQEYECRRQMLLQRLDVTILSFQWSDRVKVSVAKIYLLHAVVLHIYLKLLQLSARNT